MEKMLHGQIYEQPMIYTRGPSSMGAGCGHPFVATLFSICGHFLVPVPVGILQVIRSIEAQAPLLTKNGSTH